MKKLFIVALFLIAIGGVLLIVAYFSPDYVDENGWLTEPFAERVLGSFFILLGGLLTIISGVIIWVHSRNSDKN